MTAKDRKDSTDGQQFVPFAEDIQIDLFFSGAGRRLLLEDLKKTIADEVSVITLTGDEGSGKSMICHMIKKELPDTCYSVYFPKTLESFDDVVRVIALRLGTEGASTPVSTGELVTESIEQLKKEGKKLVAIFDEADRMYLATVERIRKMLDLANENETVLQVIFSGRKSLLENLERLSIVEFSSTKEAAFSLAPLGLSETYAYLHHVTQMRISGRNKNLFTPEAAKKIFGMAKGNLRVTNMLAARSLEKMDSEASFMVLSEHVYEDVTPINEEKRKKGDLLAIFFSGKKIYIGAAVGLVTVILLVWLNLDSGDGVKQVVLAEKDQPAIEAEKKTLPPVSELRKKDPESQENLNVQEKPQKDATPAKAFPGIEKQPVRHDDLYNMRPVKEKQIVLQKIDTREELETLKVIETTLHQRAEKDITGNDVFPEKPQPEKVEAKPAEQLEKTGNVEALAVPEPSSILEQERKKMLPVEHEREKKKVGQVTENEDDSSQADVDASETVVNTEVTREGEKEEKRQESERAETTILEIHRNGLEKIVYDTALSNKQESAETTVPPGNIEDENTVAVVPGREVVEPIIISEIKKRYPISQGNRETEDGSTLVLSVDVAKKASHIAPVRLPHRVEDRGSEPAVIPDGETLYKEALETGMRWVRGENASLYTLQLMVVPVAFSEKTLQDDFKTMVYRKLPDQLSILRNEKNLFLFYGSYPDVETARQARNQLPEKLKKYQPYPLSVSEAVAKRISE